MKISQNNRNTEDKNCKMVDFKKYERRNKNKFRF